MSGRLGYAVSPYPELTLALPGRHLIPELLEAYILRHRRLLHRPKHAVGTWYDASGGITYVDVSITPSEETVAIEYAVRYNQIGIYSLAKGEFTPTSGLGEPLADWSPLEERVPEDLE